MAVDGGEDHQLPPVRGGRRPGLLDTPCTRPGEQRQLDPGGALVWDPPWPACAQGPQLPRQDGRRQGQLEVR
uniref:Uncharacterized protein n=1 Tax=Aegilops tauschii TaxID=37682 RepID=N1R0J2_AEGTA